MKTRWIWAGLALSLGAAALAQGATKLTPGLWETTTVITDMQMQGMPSNLPPEMMQRMKPPARTVRSCLTAQEAANPRASMLAVQKDSQCKVNKMEMSGGKIAIAMVCAQDGRGGKADISMTGSFTPASYVMNGTVRASGGKAMVMTMKSRTTGKRVGDCKS
jgi:hypothetical protein